jgi:hypothetical protein
MKKYAQNQKLLILGFILKKWPAEELPKKSKTLPVHIF